MVLRIHKKWRSYEGAVRDLGLSSAPDSGELTPVFHPHIVCVGSLCCRRGMGSHPTSLAEVGPILVGMDRTYSAIKNDHSSFGLPREVKKVSIG